VPAQHPRYTSGMSETWDFLSSPAAGAAFNMALDEALLRTAAKRGRPLVRVYSWDKPAVTFGYFQKFPANLANEYEVVRRPTGGGVVYHVKDTTYTVVAPPGHTLHVMKTTDAYGVLHKAIAAAFESQPQLHDAELHSPQGQYECFQKPVRGDVVTDGRKLAGGAQRRTKSGMLHQGSIDAKLSAAQLKRGFRETLDVDFENYHVTDAERTVAEKLVVEKYAIDAWNRYLR
jgi:lipoate-protein ligase A